MRKIFTFLTAFIAVFSISAQSPCIDGLVDGNWACENVDMWSFMTIDEIGGGNNTNDCWGWTDSDSSREFAIVGKNTGTAFVEITDPANPIYWGELLTATTNTLWRDIKVIGDHAYIVSEAGDHGLQVFDLTQLLTLSETDLIFESSATLDDFGNSHNIVANEATGFVYQVGASTFSGGPHAIDVNDPDNPVTVGGYAGDGYTHDAQVVIYEGADEDYTGREIAFCANEDAVTIVDVSIKDDMEMISTFSYSDVGYTHQLWLSEDHNFLFFNDELDELDFEVNTRTYIADISDLDDVTVLGFYEADNPAIDHNLYTEGNLIYASNYRSGLRIIDYGDVENGNLIERGFFDVATSNDNPQFSGSWSNYCYFPSGSVVATDMYDGFFVLRPRIFSVSVDVIEVGCGDESTEFDITLATELSGDNFSLSYEGLPGSAVIEATEIEAPGTTTVTLSNLTSIPEGDYYFNILLVSETYGQYIIETHLVSNQDPGLVELLSPVNGADVNGPQLFEWSSVEGAVSYELQFSTTSDFEEIEFSTATTDTFYELTELTGDNTTMYWRVLSIGDCGTGVPSEEGDFIINIVSIEEWDIQAVVCYPNPVNEVLIVQMRAPIEYIEVMDVMGRIVDTIAVNYAERIEFSMVQYDSGLYFLRDPEGRILDEVMKN